VARRSAHSSDEVESDSDDEYKEVREDPDDPTPVPPEMFYEPSQEEREEDRDGNPNSLV